MEEVKGLNAAIVGGGPGCKAIMDMIFAEKLSQLRMKLIGVASTNPDAVGYRYAKEKGIYTTKDYRDLYNIKDLDMIIELTGRDEVANEILATKPGHVRLIDHVAARLFWDVFHIEEERIAERRRIEEARIAERKRIQQERIAELERIEQERIAERERVGKALRSRRDQILEEVTAVNVAIVGGGPGCKAIMDMIFAEKLSQLPMKLIGVASTNPDAVGYRYAKEKGIYTTKDYRDLYNIKDLDMIIELTGRDELANKILLTKPEDVRLMDHVAARLFWDVFHIEEQMIAELMRIEDERLVERKRAEEALKLRRDQMLEKVTALNVAIVGGGPGCKAIMDMIFAKRLSQLRMRLIGVASTNPDAVGYRYAKEKGIYTTKDYRDLYNIKDLDMIIELTGRDEVANKILLTKPEHVRLMDHIAALLFWDVFHIEEETIAERKRSEKALQKARDELEQRVAERTAELASFNKRLLSEIAERERAEEALRESIEQAEAAYKQTSIYAQELKEEITERKQAEEQILKSTAMLQAVFDGISDPLMLLDRNLEVKILNRPAAEYYEAEPENVIGKVCYRGFKGRSDPCEGCDIPPAVLGGRAVTFERKGFIHPDRLEEVVIYSIKEKDSEAGSAIIRISDITEARFMERQLIRSEKLASLGLLVSGIAHEINNPMAIINEKAGLMKDILEFSEEFEYRDKFLDSLNSILNSVGRARVITHRLLGFAKRRDVKVETIHLNQFLEEILLFLEREALHRSINVNLDFSPDLPTLESDRGQLQQVFLNIIKNGFEVVDDGGNISIVTRLKDPDTLQVMIADDGCGMSPEQLKHIFEPFYTSGKESGTGLGMYITHGIVSKNLGGQITVQSEQGKGTTFTVELPKEIRQ